MADDKKTLADLKDAVEEKETGTTETSGETDSAGAAEAPAPRVQTLDKKGRAQGTGRRKDSVARVWVFPGTGKITVNGKDSVTYFARGTQRLIINQPFAIAGREGQFDVMCLVSGGGLSGQAGAVRHGISRALENYEPTLRPTLKAAGLLTRDARRVERKKYGRRKARRGMQWAKR